MLIVISGCASGTDYRTNKDQDISIACNDVQTCNELLTEEVNRRRVMQDVNAILQGMQNARNNPLVKMRIVR